ncbi:BglG family transcription antiterminator [Pectinatus haikarae]|uniref:Activator of the mannose operon (Transcriptional antiterminator) n=1 Tax=Pectinatus haikarae TaxID=349096 RepID=A0ABT9Y7W3_9FIRM|nr:PRD domain-containing protein [Pectinatus haikarae]MDQ0203928.1 activator of the mannose operon (transcriptional antiterminator) [Pectinatus haikarae]
MTSDILSAREKKILTILLKAGDYTTASRLSRILSVSEKTVYRDFQSIRYKFKSQNFIRQEHGKGYYLDDSSSLKNIIDPVKHKDVFLGIDVETRRRNIAVLLLLQTPVETSINKLAELYFISNASIVNDLNILEQELLQYDLSLIRSRNGTHIEGTEDNIRKLLMQKINLFSASGDQSIFSFVSDTADDHALYSFFSHKDIRFVKLLLDNAEQILCGKIKDPYYINIFTHILILVKRLENNSSLCLKTSLNEYQYKNKIIAHCTTLIMNELKRYLNKTIPENEIFYIYQYLYSSRIDTNQEPPDVKFDIPHNEETAFVDELISKVSSKINFNLSKDITLKTSLLLHIRPLTKRIESRIFISNPLKNDMKKDFTQIYRAVEESLNEQVLKTDFQNLSDDETSYIAVYFQAALERQTQQKRVGIVCSSGVGTSHLLAARVKRAFPDWKIVDIVSASHAHLFNPQDTDLILSTVKIENKKDIPTVVVSAIFNDFDIVRVKQIMQII